MSNSKTALTKSLKTVKESTTDLKNSADYFHTIVLGVQKLTTKSVHAFDRKVGKSEWFALLDALQADNSNHHEWKKNVSTTKRALDAVTKGIKGGKVASANGLLDSKVETFCEMLGEEFGVELREAYAEFKTAKTVRSAKKSTIKSEIDALIATAENGTVDVMALAALLQ